MRIRATYLLSSLCFIIVSATAQNDTSWTSVTCPLSLEHPKDRFETVQILDHFEEGVTGWAARKGNQQAKARLAEDPQGHDSSGSLAVHFEFTGKDGLEYVDVGRAIKVPSPGLGLAFWIRGDGIPTSIRLRVQDRTGETHQVNLARLNDTAWRYVAASFEDQGGWWSGDGNHRLDYPCQFQSIVADRPRAGYVGKGILLIDDVALVKPVSVDEALRVEVLPHRLGNLYLPGETVRLRVQCPGTAVDWSWMDWTRDVLGQGSVPASGGEISFTLPQAGAYGCALARRAGEVVAERRTFSCGALPRPSRRRKNGFVGVCTHYRNKSYPIETMDLLVRLGLTEIRDEISWSAVEGSRGQHILPEYGETYIREARRRGIRPLLILDYGNALYDEGGYPLSDEALTGYANYGAFLARALRKDVQSFEVWNEYSGGCGMRGKTGTQTPESYARMLEATYRAVKESAPRSTVVGIGGEHSRHHFQQIDSMLVAGAARNMDAFSVHSYRYPQGPEESDLAGEILEVAKLAGEHGAPQRIWVTEIGWPTHLGPRGVDEATQAIYAVRTLALLQSTGVVEKVHWYDLRNDGVQRTYNEHNFGLVWHQTYNYAPKPAALAVAVYARMTARR